MQKVQNIPGLANLCRDVWFMFPKERYQYSKQSSDNPQENNIGAQMSSETTMENEAVDESECNSSNLSTDTFNDLDDNTMDVIDDSDDSPITSNFDSNTENDDMDDAIFLSTFDRSKISMSESEEDQPVYDDGD